MNPTTHAPSVWARWFSLQNRYLPPLFITCILTVGQLSYGLLESYSRTLLAIGTAIAIELMVGRLFWGRWPHLASAYVSGISVGILVRSPLYWPFALCSLLSITSKYALTYRGRHIFNPSNFGICALLFLAPFAVAYIGVRQRIRIERDGRSQCFVVAL